MNPDVPQFELYWREQIAFELSMTFPDIDPEIINAVRNGDE